MSSKISSSAAQAARLAELIGLDVESVQSQVLPFLTTFTSADSLRVHLVDLLGPSAEAKAFIDEYVRSRFPGSETAAKTPVPSVGSTASRAPAANASTSSSSTTPSKPHPAPKQKLTAKQRLLQPAKAKRVVTESNAALDAFGSVGTVYHKGDIVLDGYRAPSSQASAAASAATSSSSTLAASSATPTSIQASRASDIRARTAASTEQVEAASSPAVSASPQAPAATTPELEAIAPTAAMKELDALIAELTVADEHLAQGPSQLVVCFCQGRVHPLHPHQSLCPSCALPLCASLFPSPLHPHSRCPSCARSPIIPPSSPLRTQLLASLQSQRLALELEERERIERVRRERRARDDVARERARAAAHAFPALGQAPTLSSSTTTTSSGGHTYGVPGYGARSDAVALALGRRAPTEAERAVAQQRTHRVIRIPAKNAPVPKKGKKSKKAKGETAASAKAGGQVGSRTSANASAPPSASTTGPINEDEEDDGDASDADADGLAESKVEVTVTILVADPEDDGWAAHDQVGEHRSVEATSRLKPPADRPLLNLRLDAAIRPFYTSLKEREARKAVWDALEDEEQVGEGEVDITATT